MNIIFGFFTVFTVVSFMTFARGWFHSRRFLHVGAMASSYSLLVLVHWAKMSDVHMSVGLEQSLLAVVMLLGLYGLYKYWSGYLL